MKLILPLIALLATFTLSNCSSSSNITSRIEKNPEIYNELTVHEQELISQGLLEEGMSPNAVFIALGAPDRRLEGSSDGKKTSRWDYTSLSPIYSSSFHGGFGRGFGRHGGFRRGGFGGFRGGHRGFGGFGSSVSYVPTLSSTVWFVDDRVRSWERVR